MSLTASELGWLAPALPPNQQRLRQGSPLGSVLPELLLSIQFILDHAREKIVVAHVEASETRWTVGVGI